MSRLKLFGRICRRRQVRIIAEMPARVECMMQRERLSSPEEALAMVKNVDEERRKWSTSLYNMDSWDSRLYDIVINIGKISLDDAVHMICDTIKKKAFQTTPESQKQIDNLLADAQKKLKDASVKSPFFEPLRTSPWKK